MSSSLTALSIHATSFVPEEDRCRFDAPFATLVCSIVDDLEDANYTSTSAAYPAVPSEQVELGFASKVATQASPPSSLSEMSYDRHFEVLLSCELSRARADMPAQDALCEAIKVTAQVSKVANVVQDSISPAAPPSSSAADKSARPLVTASAVGPSASSLSSSSSSSSASSSSSSSSAQMLQSQGTRGSNSGGAMAPPHSSQLQQQTPRGAFVGGNGSGAGVGGGGVDIGWAPSSPLQEVPPFLRGLPMMPGWGGGVTPGYSPGYPPGYPLQPMGYPAHPISMGYPMPSGYAGYPPGPPMSYSGYPGGYPWYPMSNSGYPGHSPMPFGFPGSTLSSGTFPFFGAPMGGSMGYLSPAAAQAMFSQGSFLPLASSAATASSSNSSSAAAPAAPPSNYLLSAQIHVPGVADGNPFLSYGSVVRLRRIGSGGRRNPTLMLNTTSSSSSSSSLHGGSVSGGGGVSQSDSTAWTLPPFHGHIVLGQPVFGEKGHRVYMGDLLLPQHVPVPGSPLANGDFEIEARVLAVERQSEIVHLRLPSRLILKQCIQCLHSYCTTKGEVGVLRAPNVVYQNCGHQVLCQQHADAVWSSEKMRSDTKMNARPFVFCELCGHRNFGSVPAASLSENLLPRHSQSVIQYVQGVSFHARFDSTFGPLRYLTWGLRFTQYLLQQLRSPNEYSFATREHVELVQTLAASFAARLFPDPQHLSPLLLDCIQASVEETQSPAAAANSLTTSSSDKPPPPRLSFYDKALSTEQQEAVAAVASGLHAQVPYLLCGPAGCGKTRVLVEMIRQLLLAQDSSGPKRRLLIVAQSDPAADIILKNLAPFFAGINGGSAIRSHSSGGKSSNSSSGGLQGATSSKSHTTSSSGSSPLARLLRFNLQSRMFDSLPRELRHFASHNPTKGIFTYPSLETVQSADVIVTTALACGVLLECSGIKAAALRSETMGPLSVEEFARYGEVSAALASKGPLGPLNFTHVIVDEASQTLEPELLLAFFLAGKNTRIILSGDPMQLGPSVKSPLAARYGLDTSMQERLLSMPLMKGVAADVPPDNKKKEDEIVGEEIAAAANASLSGLPLVASPSSLSSSASSATSDALSSSSVLPYSSTTSAYLLDAYLKYIRKDFKSLREGDSLYTLLEKERREEAAPTNRGGSASSSSSNSSSYSSSRDPVLEAYGVPFHAVVCTCLTQNYRSHPLLLGLSSRLFYEGTLTSQVPESVASACTSWSLLSPSYRARCLALSGAATAATGNSNSSNSNSSSAASVCYCSASTPQSAAMTAPLSAAALPSQTFDASEGDETAFITPLLCIGVSGREKRELLTPNFSNAEEVEALEWAIRRLLFEGNPAQYFAPTCRDFWMLRGSSSPSIATAAGGEEGGSDCLGETVRLCSPIQKRAASSDSSTSSATSSSSSSSSSSSAAAMATAPTPPPLMKLTQDDIGVIAASRSQVAAIRSALRKVELGQISVGLVQNFQGQEKKVILISTVFSKAYGKLALSAISDMRAQRARSSTRVDKTFSSLSSSSITPAAPTSEAILRDTVIGSLGIFGDPKPFNVAITRAQSLLICVGDPNVWVNDPCWRKLLSFAVDRGNYIGWNGLKCPTAPSSASLFF